MMKTFKATKQIGDIKNMSGFKNNTYNSMMPVIFILRILCLSCNIKKANIKSGAIIIKSLFALTILGGLNFTAFYYKIVYGYKALDLSIKLTDGVQIIYDFFEYVIDLYFVYKYGRYTSVEYFKQYDIIDNFLNVTCYSTIKSQLLKLIVLYTIIWAISTTGQLSAWVLAYGWLLPICHSPSSIFLFIKILTVIDLIAHVTHIGIRLKIIGDMMQSCYFSTENAPNGCTADCVGNKRWLYANDHKQTHTIKVNCNSRNIVEKLTSCYLLLSEQVSFINNIYGFRIVLNTLSLLFNMIKITNLAVRIIIGTQRTLYGTGYFTAISSLLQLVTCAAIFIILVNQCERVYRERERTANIMDHLLINKNPDPEMRAAMVKFRGLLQERPIQFNMANFFTLSYSLLVSLASVVVTYTIILLQSVS